MPANSIDMIASGAKSSLRRAREGALVGAEVTRFCALVGRRLGLVIQSLLLLGKVLLAVLCETRLASWRAKGGSVSIVA